MSRGDVHEVGQVARRSAPIVLTHLDEVSDSEIVRTSCNRQLEFLQDSNVSVREGYSLSSNLGDSVRHRISSQARYDSPVDSLHWDECVRSTHGDDVHCCVSPVVRVQAYGVR